MEKSQQVSYTTSKVGTATVPAAELALSQWAAIAHKSAVWAIDISD